MNTFGNIFRISIFGESHGPSVGILIDGCPPGIQINETDFTKELSRRRSGAKGTTPRKEKDQPLIQSGIYNGYTTGSPISILFENTSKKSEDYDTFRQIPRPGHADFTSTKKYKGFADLNGGGHFSGRLTTGIVAAGVLAKKILSNIQIAAKIIEVGGNRNIEQAVDKAIEQKDSIGGIIECRVNGLPVGLGEPFFNSVESLISHMIFSIPAIKGIEFGSGFEAAKMKGSEHNDSFVNKNGKTQSNHAGGINGGITNGNELVFRVAVKPTSSTSKPQETFDFENKKMTTLEVKGRHDLCIALRMPVIIEAATAICLADLILMQNIYKNQ